MRFFIVIQDSPKYHFKKFDVVYTGHRFIELCSTPKQKASQILDLRYHREFRGQRWLIYNDLESLNLKLWKDIEDILLEVDETVLEITAFDKLFIRSINHLPDRKNDSLSPKKLAKKLHRQIWSY